MSADLQRHRQSSPFHAMPINLAKVAGVSAGTAALLAISYPYIAKLTSPILSFVPDFPLAEAPFSVPLFTSHPADEPAPFACDSTHQYKTEIVSLDPLVIYIHSLLTPTEITSLVSTAEPAFAPSEVVKNGRELRTQDRTSSSAGLPRDDPAVACVLSRARRFMGTMMRDGWDDMGPPQLVRYRAGQRFNLHHDWYNVPRRGKADESPPRKWNRVASFFATLQDNCTGGETHFPFISGVAQPAPWGQPTWLGGLEGERERRTGPEGDVQPLWREHEDGGLAFRPVAGNAIFWVNLHANGTGDLRTRHAGLPLGDGLKTAMNIWPRQYYPSA